MAQNNIPKLSPAQKELLLSKSPYALPDNPSDKHFSASQIKRKMYEGLLVLFDYLNAFIDSVNSNVTLSNQDLQTMQSDIGTLQSFFENGICKKATADANGNNIASTYETKSDATAKHNENSTEINKIKNGDTVVGKAEKDKNNNDIVSTYETKSHANSVFDTLTENIASALATAKAYADVLVQRSALVTTLGEASTSLSGLMSAEDKTRLDTLFALLGDTADADTVVNTINEVLSIFNQYPEGVEIASALAGKVNVSDVVDNLTSEETAKPLSAKQGKTLKSLIDTNVTAINNIVNGTTIVKKAERDGRNNNIFNTYATKNQINGLYDAMWQEFDYCRENDIKNVFFCSTEHDREGILSRLRMGAEIAFWDSEQEGWYWLDDPQDFEDWLDDNEIIINNKWFSYRDNVDLTDILGSNEITILTKDNESFFAINGSSESRLLKNGDIVKQLNYGNSIDAFAIDRVYFGGTLQNVKSEKNVTYFMDMKWNVSGGIDILKSMLRNHECTLWIPNDYRYFDCIDDIGDFEDWLDDNEMELYDPIENVCEGNYSKYSFGEDGEDGEEWVETYAHMFFVISPDGSNFYVIKRGVLSWFFKNGDLLKVIDPLEIYSGGYSDAVYFDGEFHRTEVIIPYHSISKTTRYITTFNILFEGNVSDYTGYIIKSFNLVTYNNTNANTSNSMLRPLFGLKDGEKVPMQGIIIERDANNNEISHQIVAFKRSGPSGRVVLLDGTEINWVGSSFANWYSNDLIISCANYEYIVSVNYH